MDVITPLLHCDRRKVKVTTRGIEVTHEEDDVVSDGGTRRVPLTLMDGEGSPTAQQLADAAVTENGFAIHEILLFNFRMIRLGTSDQPPDHGTLRL